MTNLEKCTLITEEICKKTQLIEKNLGKKMIQKLLYLIERRGLNLDLNYSIHYFGPYSAKLDNTLHMLENYGIIDIDTTGTTHIIKLGNNHFKGELNSNEQEKVDYVLDHFLGKTALELEAITTLDYAANTILKESSREDEIIKQVIKIKGTKFNEDYLKEELKILKDAKYLQPMA